MASQDMFASLETEEKLELLYNNSLVEGKNLEILMNNTDQFFLIVIAIIIFFMQCGFAFLEAGSVRSKNTVNILIKNMLDAFIGGVSYWAIGWGLAYGEGGNLFCGGSQFFNYQLSYALYPKWFFQFVFAATAATIVSGAIAERCQFFAYFAYSIIITGWVYPPVSHWAWDGAGWLAQTGFYKDFAGSGVVHLMGGSCAIVGCYFMGARRGRFNKKGDPIDMPGHSVPLAGLGGFILIFGFLAFNGGSQAQIAHEGDGDVVALAIVNTILGASTGGLVVLFINKFMFKQPWSFLMCLNGALAGMVSLCGGCNLYEPWAALIVGALGGIGFIVVHFAMLRLQLDDPLDAVAVHGAGGLVGILSVPWFMYVGLEKGERGIFWDGDASTPWLVLGYNIAGALCISLWSAFWCALLFGSLYFLKMLRVSIDDEFKGMDLIKHGESAYPAAAWVEYQYAKSGQAQNGTDSVPVNMSSDGLGATVTMSGIKEDKTGAAFNNPFEMVPTTGQLFKQMSSTFLSVTANQEGGGLQARQEDIDAYNTKQAEAHDNKAYDRKEKE
eukprot:TRINITY_DN1716_c0_g1_i2.p1 TRINITY_DN1716_c0_g1~~TRINITY_DN1716_c0_g1_i2.p1  ORF type:complete len:555 (-),score=145.72 TRINITY_DN1716_c0_g1_i2:254-1918(-)